NKRTGRVVKPMRQQLRQALEAEVGREHASRQPTQVQLGIHAFSRLVNATDAVQLSGDPAVAKCQRNTQGVIQTVPVVADARRSLPGIPLYAREQIGTEDHALLRRFMAGYGIEQGLTRQKRINRTQLRAGFAAARGDVVWNVELRIAYRSTQAFVKDLTLPLCPQFVDVLVGKVEQAERLAAGSFGAGEHMGVARVVDKQPTPILPFVEQGGA